MKWYTLHTPQGNGTILSPDKYMMDHHYIAEFAHQGTRTGKGSITFYNKNHKQCNKITMTRREDGLWFTTNPVLVPTTPTIHTMNNNPDTKSRSAVLQYTLWHQRLGHIHPTALAKTAQMVEGMPSLSHPPPLFKCPFCDAAKMHKQAANKTSNREVYLPGTQFHMDVGFLNHKTTKQESVKSQEGYVAYLLIIDVASRYVWTFLLKNKHPPVVTIEQFLHQHGKATKGHITTTTDGMLQRSKTFHRLCHHLGYTIRQITADVYEPTSQPHFVVRTDNGGELAGSNQIRDVIHKHGYVLETTAPGSSSQNGMAERPHRTLKNKVRCLLYTAGLPHTFWSHALRHATWLYNRTVHSAVETTPYQAYTGKTPTLDGLITFGSSIKAKKTQPKKNQLDPNHFNGIFLGYRATQDNIIFWDTDAQRTRTAKHCSMDELQYGIPSDERSPGANMMMTVANGDSASTTGTLVEDQPVSCLATSDETAIQINKFYIPPAETIKTDLETLDVTLDLLHHSTSVIIPVLGLHPTLGLIVVPHPEYHNMVILQSCQPGTSAHKNIRRWKSEYRGAAITKIGNHHIHTTDDVQKAVLQCRQARQQQIRLQFATPHWHPLDNTGVPTVNFDQLNVIAHHLNTIAMGQATWTDPLTWPPIQLHTIIRALQSNLIVSKLTRRKLQNSPTWHSFQKSEWAQLDKYLKQAMFGDPQPAPTDPLAVILPWVWTYLFKLDPLTLEEKPKARGTCNGGKQHGKVVTLEETYAACVEQPAHRLMWALVAALSYIALGCDVGNAFAEAPAPKVQFYMKVDAQFHEWWTQHLQRPPIPKGYVIPIQKNLQGHPEAPRLWHKHITKILTEKLNFKHTTHEPCLYFKYNEQQQLLLILRQVDDFIIAAPTLQQCQDIRTMIQKYMTNPLNDLGIIKRFNGLDIEQTADYVKLSCPTYIDKIIEHHKWHDLPKSNIPVPMRYESTYQASLELTDGPTAPDEQKHLEKQMGFSYRQAIGEVIFAMTICRPDIAAAVIKLSQYSASPAKCHYQAVKAVFQYLLSTRDHGLYFWRPNRRTDLPVAPAPHLMSSQPPDEHFPTATDPQQLYGATDATWAADRRHRRSTTGVALLFAGGTVYYRTRLQPTVAQSSTEAELAAMTDAGKAALYLRSILDELGLTQQMPTMIYADNAGAIHITKSQQPTKRTRHVDMKLFCILQWTDEEQIEFPPISTEHNPADSLSKQTGRIKFHHQMDMLMGRRPPKYHSSERTFSIASISTCRDLSYLLDTPDSTSVGG